MTDINPENFKAEPLGNRIYDVKSLEFCVRCKRSLKGKTAYLDHANNLFCHDTSSKAQPLEIILCLILSKIHDMLNDRKMKISRSAVKKIDKVMKESLEE